MADTLDTVEGTGGTYKELAASCRSSAELLAHISADTPGTMGQTRKVAELRSRNLEIRAASYEIVNALWEIAEKSYNLYATGRP